MRCQNGQSTPKSRCPKRAVWCLDFGRDGKRYACANHGGGGWSRDLLPGAAVKKIMDKFEDQADLTLWTFDGAASFVGPKGQGPHSGKKESRHVSVGRTPLGRLGFEIEVRGQKKKIYFVLTRKQVKALQDHLVYQLPRLTLAKARNAGKEVRRMQKELEAVDLEAQP
jgi:hypothetical protein